MTAQGRTRACILGCEGLTLDVEERAFFRELKPWGFILFARNIGDADQVLPVASLHDAERRLKVLGFDVASHVSRGLTHSIDDAGLQLGGQFLVNKLA